MMDSENKLSYEGLAALERKEREELDSLRIRLRKTEELLGEVEKWWKDSSQANFALTARLKRADSETEKIVAEERRQKLIWKEAYESVTGSRTWRMITKVKGIFGRK